mmetsp:Transcript_12038/g.18302  ORF Transcript_12038/g.18302 Transcript_12038/m.18302 type:complete len:81 (-) Transcript_12038:518-760(-)
MILYSLFFCPLLIESASILSQLVKNNATIRLYRPIASRKTIVKIASQVTGNEVLATKTLFSFNKDVFSVFSPTLMLLPAR